MKLAQILSLAALCLLSGRAYSQGFGPEQVLSATTGSYLDAVACDLDGDGDLDVVEISYSGGDGLTWTENLGGGVFGQTEVIFSGYLTYKALSVIDYDGDGDSDIIVAGSYFVVSLFENLGGGNFGPQYPLLQDSLGAAASITAFDVDLDGDEDIFLTRIGDLDPTWLENLGGHFGPPKTLVSSFMWMSGLLQLDIDGDGGPDILVVGNSWGADQLSWFKYLGSGNFGPEQLIPSAGPSIQSAAAGDFSGSGGRDLIVSSSSVDGVAWFEYLGGAQYAPAKAISSSQNIIACVGAEDLDGDGLDDAWATDSTGKSLLWYRNLGGGSFGPEQVIGKGSITPYSTSTADLDGDGGADVLSNWVGGRTSWFKNEMIEDCNGTGYPDALEILSGASQDCDGNGVPDECDLLVPGGDIDGDGALDVCVPPPLMADKYELSVSAGGTQTFALSAPKEMDLYLLLGSASGTSPGIPIGPVSLPLNSDAYFLHTASVLNMPPLGSSLGILLPAPSGGMATATFTLAPSSSSTLVGLTVHHAYLTVGLFDGVVNFTSNAVPLTLLP